MAGFIGSNLLQTLLTLNQKVTGIDNLSTGLQYNLDAVKNIVSSTQWENFTFIKNDVRDLNICHQITKNVDIVLHQAAIGSVTCSIENPIATHENNITAFLNILIAAKNNRINRIIYASSSSVYGDEKQLPKVEEKIGMPLSPYAVTKLSNELYAHTFSKNYNMKIIGLRYFNVFGPKQNPNGNYTAVIPLWINKMIQQQPIEIFGDGKTSRDFCFIDHVVQANLLAAMTQQQNALNTVYNIAQHQQTTLNELAALIQNQIKLYLPKIKICHPIYKDFRSGDVQYSWASIEKAKKLLNYNPTYSIQDGLIITIEWFLREFKDMLIYG